MTKNKRNPVPVLETIPAGSGTGFQNSGAGSTETGTGFTISGPAPTGSGTGSTQFDQVPGPAHP